MTTNATKTLRTFTQDDWDLFAGCESDNPQIAETDKRCYILDDEVVNVYCHHETNDGLEETVHSSGFRNSKEAEQVIQALLLAEGTLPDRDFQVLLCAAISFPL